jgi:hypothetical protein
MIGPAGCSGASKNRAQRVPRQFSEPSPARDGLVAEPHPTPVDEQAPGDHVGVHVPRRVGRPDRQEVEAAGVERVGGEDVRQPEPARDDRVVAARGVVAHPAQAAEPGPLARDQPEAGVAGARRPVAPREQAERPLAGRARARELRRGEHVVVVALHEVGPPVAVEVAEQDPGARLVARRVAGQRPAELRHPRRAADVLEAPAAGPPHVEALDGAAAERGRPDLVRADRDVEPAVPVDVGDRRRAVVGGLVRDAERRAALGEAIEPSPAEQQAVADRRAPPELGDVRAVGVVGDERVEVAVVVEVGEVRDRRAAGRVRGGVGRVDDRDRVLAEAQASAAEQHPQRPVVVDDEQVRPAVVVEVLDREAGGVDAAIGDARDGDAAEQRALRRGVAGAVGLRDLRGRRRGAAAGAARGVGGRGGERGAEHGRRGGVQRGADHDAGPGIGAICRLHALPLQVASGRSARASAARVRAYRWSRARLCSWAGSRARSYSSRSPDAYSTYTWRRVRIARYGGMSGAARYGW